MTGHVGLFGGPLDPTTGRMADDDSPAAGMTVTAKSADGRTVRTTTGADGRFVLSLVPGRYSVSSGCGEAESVLVAAGRPTAVALRCDVP